MILSCKKFVPVVLMLASSFPVFSQSLSINTDGSAANASAMLDIKSNTKGLLIPRFTKAEKNAVATPATGLLIYQTGPDSTGFYYYQNLRWNWLADNNKNDSSYWGLHGNSNMRPPLGNQFDPIDFVNDTYLGSYESKDISMIAGGNELLRIKQVPLGGRIGFSNRNPEYALDIRLSDPSPTSEIVGMRIIPSQLFNSSTPVNVNKGIVFGNDVNNIKETVIWNYSNNIDAAIRIGFDMFNPGIRPAININQFGEGIYQRNPKYALDIHSMSQFAPANQLTPKNGVRITFPNQESQNNPDRGMFMGVMTNPTYMYRSYVWNYADGTGGNSPDKAIYFGVGGDMDFSTQKPTMEMQDGKIIMGHVTDPNYFFPGTLNIQTDYASGVAKNGLSIMKHLVNGVESAYFGTDVNDNLDILKYGGGKIFMGAAAEVPITISANNFVGIKTLYPNSDLQFDDSYVNNKLVLHNNFWGDFPNSGHNFYGFGVNANVLRYQVPGNGADHVFYAANTTNTASNELMRIKGNGFVGINNNNPQAPLEFSGTPENRKIVLGGFGINNDHNFVGFGLNGSDLRYQVPYSTDDHIFYRGDAGGSSSTELMRIKGNGNVGIGTTAPIQKTEIIGLSATPVTLVIGNRGGSGLAAMEFVSEYGFGTQWRPGYMRSNDIGSYTGSLEFYTNGTGAGNLYGSVKGLEVRNGVTYTATGTVTSWSDERLKKNIQPFTSGLEIIRQINPVSYFYNSQSPFQTDKMQVGVLAQELEKVAPYMVDKNNTKDFTDLRSVNNQAYIFLLINAVKEQQKQLDEQRKMIEELRRK